MTQQTVTLPVDPKYQQKIRQVLVEADFELFEAPHAFYRAKGPGCTVVFYQSGKLVLQGPNAQTLAAVLGLAEESVPHAPDATERFAAALAKHPEPKPDAWIGQDEVGKGDYFGPLVVVSVRLERERVPLLVELGVADSKSLGDQKMQQIAKDLHHVVDHQVVAIGPDSYNRLYAKFRNLNRMLAWAHARAMEDLLSAVPASYAIVDQFATEHVLRRQLMEAGKAINVEQRTKAEEDPAVAVASILARDEFLKRMKALSNKAGMTIPKGAGSPVLAAGRKLVAKLGADALGQYAKLHFKTTDQILHR